MARVIGITGGIGTGKSVVSNYLKEKGYLVIDADDIGRTVTGKDGKAIKALSEIFGNDIVLSNGELDRKKVSDIAFSSIKNKKALESIITDEIIGIIKYKIDNFRKTFEFQNKLAFLDAPTLFETGCDILVDDIWVISAPLDVRIERVKNRNGFTVEEIQRRISSQLPEEYKKTRATEIIDNSGDIKNLEIQVDLLLKKYINEASFV